MLGLNAITQYVKTCGDAAEGIDARRQRGIAPQTGQPPYIPDLKDGALRRSW